MFTLMDQPEINTCIYILDHRLFEHIRHTGDVSLHHLGDEYEGWIESLTLKLWGDIGTAQHIYGSLRHLRAKKDCIAQTVFVADNNGQPI
jgi:hypothetical protein